MNADAARAYYAMMTGVDLTALDPNASFSSVTTEGGRTQVERYRDTSVADAAADFIRRGMRELIVAGTPRDAAEQIRSIVEGPTLTVSTTRRSFRPARTSTWSTELSLSCRRWGWSVPSELAALSENAYLATATPVYQAATARPDSASAPPRKPGTE